MNLLTRIDIVLVEPSEGGNVGSCCRALQNCGVSHLALVRPRFSGWDEARKLAVHAADMLGRARVFDTLRDAVAHAHWVVGTSARLRSPAVRKPPIEPEALIAGLRALPAGARAALVFGPERTGLSNAQLGLCQDVLRLPTAETYASMNLAHAVLAVAWTLRMADEARRPATATRRELASAAELEGLMRHAEHTLRIIDYLDPQNPRLVLDELRKVFARAQLDPRELRMLRGIFHRMDVWIAAHGGPPTPNQRTR